MTKLLILSKYENLGASSRLRSFGFVQYFKDAGLETTISALFSNKYLEHLYSRNKRSKLSIIKSYLNRLFVVLFLARKFDVIFIEKELFPYLPGVFEKLIRLTRIPYIVDYDDAIFHNYDLSSSHLIRKCLSNKLRCLLSHAHCVTVGNSYLQKLAKNYGAKKTHIVPTVVDINRYTAKFQPLTEEVIIGWIGSPSTTPYLKSLWPVFEQLSKKRKIKLMTIGADVINDCPIPLEQYPWSLETECELLQRISFGIMPLDDGPWEKGKCGFKLIQYMASSKPVIASKVGANIDIVTSDVGYLVSNELEWQEAINRLAYSQELLSVMGKHARKRVEKLYTMQINGPVLANLINEIAKKC